MSNTDQEINLKNQLGQQIKKARQLAGFSQKELAEALELSDKTISAYEVGRVQPNLQTLKNLSRATHQPISYFVDDSPQDNYDLQIKIKTIEQELLEIRRILQKKTKDRKTQD